MYSPMKTKNVNNLKKTGEYNFVLNIINHSSGSQEPHRADFIKLSPDLHVPNLGHTFNNFDVIIQ